MSQEHRQELADFLRSRRARTRPEDVGLPRGSRRRLHGLRREEIALLAGVSTTWYTYLEQGRDVHPSTQVLTAIARVLRLDEDETRYVHRLAEDATRASLTADLTAADIVTRLVQRDWNCPYPTYAFDDYCDLIAWNPATVGYYTDFAALPAEERNMMRWLIASDEAPRRLSDWDNDLPDIVARWRKAAAVADHDRLARQVDEYRRLNPQFGGWWDSHDVREHHTRLRHFSHPELGPVTLRVIVVESPEFAGIRIAYHVRPGDEEQPAHPAD